MTLFEQYQTWLEGEVVRGVNFGGNNTRNLPTKTGEVVSLVPTTEAEHLNHLSRLAQQTQHHDERTLYDEEGAEDAYKASFKQTRKALVNYANQHHDGDVENAAYAADYHIQRDPNIKHSEPRSSKFLRMTVGQHVRDAAHHIIHGHHPTDSEF